MPSDDLAQGFDDVKRAHPGVSQDGVCGVAKAEASDHDVEIGTRDAGERELGKCDLGHGEEARHEELIAQLRLVDVDLQGWLESTSQADLTQGCRPPVELLEAGTHRVIPLPCGSVGLLGGRWGVLEGQVRTWDGTVVGEPSQVKRGSSHSTVHRLPAKTKGSPAPGTTSNGSSLGSTVQPSSQVFHHHVGGHVGLVLRWHIHDKL